MSTIKIKTQNGYEKVEIPSCLPANVEFGEPEDWTDRWNTSFVADCDGILCVFASQGNMNGTLWCRDNGDTVAAEGITTGYSGSITLSIKNGRTYSIENTNGLTFSVKRATFYPFKTKPVNDYSTDEICIGKWIDGKPLYRKVFSGNFKNTTDGIRTYEDISLASLNILEVVSIKGMCLHASNSYIPIPYAYANNTMTFPHTGVLVDLNTKLLRVGNAVSNYNGNPFKIIIEYTKQ